MELELFKSSRNYKNYSNADLKLDDYFSRPCMFFTKEYENVPFINRYNKSSAFLIAGGPSFGKVDKKQLLHPGILTMGINNSPSTFRPNLWTCVDSPSNFLASVWLDPTIEKIVPISHINKRLFDSEKWRDRNTTVGDCPNVFYFRRNELFNHNQYLEEDSINWGNHTDLGGGRSVLLAAIKILYLFGIKNIYLLGVDFYMDDKYNYHFEQSRTNSSIKCNMNTYGKMIKRFSELKSKFDKVGLNIYNCNPDSRLKVFPFISVENAVDKTLNIMPDIDREKTNGMYSRIAEMRQKKTVKRPECNNVDDGLFKIKNDYFKFLNSIYKDEKQSRDWAFNSVRPTRTDMAIAFDNVKRWVLNRSIPSDKNYKKMYQLQFILNSKRKKLSK